MKTLEDQLLESQTKLDSLWDSWSNIRNEVNYLEYNISRLKVEIKERDKNNDG